MDPTNLSEHTHPGPACAKLCTPEKQVFFPLLFFSTIITALKNHYPTHTLGRLFLEVPITVCTFRLCTLLDIKFTETCYVMETGDKGLAALGLVTLFAAKFSSALNIFLVPETVQ